MTIGMLQSVQGLQRAEAQVNHVAQALALPQSDLASLSTEVVTLLQARNNFEANLKALETADEMTKTLLATL